MRNEKIIIHDLSNDELSQLDLAAKEYLIIDANTKTANCMGCFGCWLKTPGKCVIKDAFEYIGAVMAQGKEIIVISQNCYGGYSPNIKRVFDRSIATSLPFFTYRGGAIHHWCRYKNRPSFTVYLYGKISDFEKEIAREVVHANGINMGSQNTQLFFAEEPLQFKEVWQ